jgi:hypothetical protein
MKVAALALRCLLVLPAGAVMHAHAQTAVPLSYSVVLCTDYAAQGGEKRLEVTGGGAFIECETGFTSTTGREKWTVKTSGSTYYPGSGLPARVDAAAVVTYDMGNFGDGGGRGAGGLSYYLRLDEKLPPPFDPGTIPLIMHVEGRIETVEASGFIGVALRGPGTGAFSFYQQNIKPTFSQSWSEDLPVRVDVGSIQGFTKEAQCTAYAGRGAGTRSCSAMVDPVFSFDQAFFDDSFGAQSFSLEEHYRMVFSPVPEPGTLLLATLGLSVLGWRRRRGAAP